MTIKDDLHQFVDRLSDEDARRLLEDLRARGLPRSLAEAPLDDEPVTPDDLVALAEARHATAQGDIVKDEDLERDL